MFCILTFIDVTMVCCHNLDGDFYWCKSSLLSNCIKEFVGYFVVVCTLQLVVMIRKSCHDDSYIASHITR